MRTLGAIMRCASISFIILRRGDIISHFLNQKAELRRLICLLIIHSDDAKRIPLGVAGNREEISMQVDPQTVNHDVGDSLLLTHALLCPAFTLDVLLGD